jgi:hypothetical protein
MAAVRFDPDMGIDTYDSFDVSAARRPACLYHTKAKNCMIP